MNNFVGQIALFPYNFAPQGWMDCAGQILPISQYTALFSLVGTYYGGNGTSNFALPNLQGQVAVNNGQLNGGSLYGLGEAGGAANVTLTTATMPSHSHSLNAVTAHGSANSPAGAVLATPESGSGVNANKGEIYNPASPTTQLASNAITPAGGNLPHNNLQPCLALRYCIAIAGIFPSRG